jgi:hypothetical protein
VLIMLFRPRGLWPRPERSRKKDDDINNKPVATTTVV